MLFLRPAAGFAGRFYLGHLWLFDREDRQGVQEPLAVIFGEQAFVINHHLAPAAVATYQAADLLNQIKRRRR